MLSGSTMGTNTLGVWIYLLPLLCAVLTGGMGLLVLRLLGSDHGVEYRICGRTLSETMPSGIPCRVRRNPFKTWQGKLTVIQPSGVEKDFPLKWFGPVLDEDALADAMDSYDGGAKVHPKDLNDA